MGELVVTMKEHGGYDATWYVVHGQSVAEVADILKAVEATGLAAIVAGAKASIGAVNNLAEVFPGIAPVQHPATTEQQYYQGGQQPQQPAYQPQQQARPAQQGPPPGVIAPRCMHGTKNFVANGAYGPFWGCPAPRNEPSKCKAEKYIP